jgi:24-hydroxycholesterol 7alpha-hydroxylase
MWICFPAFFVVLSISAIFLLAVFGALRQSRTSKVPPLKTGCIPWLGCAIEFGKEPLNVIRRTQIELGDIFTIHAAGKYITFLTDPKDFGWFFQNKSADFQAAVQPYTKNTAGIPQEAFLLHHTTLHDTVKGTFIPASMRELVPKLGQRFSTVLDSYADQGEMDLMEFVKVAMFTAVVKEIFGDDFVPADDREMAEFRNHFFKFDADFEYGAELPEMFLRNWKGHKYWLLDFFTSAVSSLKQASSSSSDNTEQKTLFKSILDLVGEKYSPNFALLMLWASQANAVPVVFWTLAFMLDDPVVMGTVLNELEEANTSTKECSDSWLRECMGVKRCVLETVRLRSPGIITRKVTETFAVKGFVIPKGHFLMLSPFWAHRNEDFFPNPETYDPDRWRSCDFDKFQFLEGFVGFGGGRYQCPGRWFALMEMHLFVAIILSKFHFELLDKVPEPSPLHVIGSQQPAGSCRIRFKKR